MQIIQYIVPLLMIHARRTSGLPNSKNWRGVLETLGLWAIVKAISGWWGLSIGITVGHYSDVAWRQGETTPTLDEIRDCGLRMGTGYGDQS